MEQTIEQSSKLDKNWALLLSPNKLRFFLVHLSDARCIGDMEILWVQIGLVIFRTVQEAYDRNDSDMRQNLYEGSCFQVSSSASP